MTDNRFSKIRNDCLLACEGHEDVRNSLGFKHISMTGGTGFLGTWIAENIAALNDEYRLNITIDLYARNTKDWATKYPHLSERVDVNLINQDVRSNFEFSRKTNFVIHAAGIPNNRVHASDPLRVYNTTIEGLSNALDAASYLDNLARFINVSSCLVSGPTQREGALKETEYFPMTCGQLHTVYTEAKRSAESLAAIYRSQLRMPISTLRPFTFAGPYQDLDRPWALNNFVRDVLSGANIRVLGDGLARRSYLYGSDAAMWTLAALVKGKDGDIYNLGSPISVSHLELINLINKYASKSSKVLLNTGSEKSGPDDLFPDTEFTRKSLGVSQTCALAQTIEKTLDWFSNQA